MNILIVGSGAREHAIAKAVKRSHTAHALYCFASFNNPWIPALCKGSIIESLRDVKKIAEFAKENSCDFAIIGPEAPLAAGCADELLKNGIPAIGPVKQLARIESSKGFARDLLTKYEVPGLPRYQRFSSLDGLKEYADTFENGYVVKADGLMGGKGVKVYGEHLLSWDDTLLYCKKLVENNSPFVIEEKFTGQEFSLMSFSDGEHLIHTPAVQDYKRAFDGDYGPNTGGMGCISDANHSLPFLELSDIEQAKKINELAIAALKKEFSVGYQGILYGGFMAAKNGVKLIEYNARFGDPECISVLSIMQTDFIILCKAIIQKKLHQQTLIFEKKATVCKYLVPLGYPDKPIKDSEIDISSLPSRADVCFGAVEQRDGKLYETGSRAIAVLAKADTIQQAGILAENWIAHFRGPFFHRKDIGTQELLEKRINMMKALRKTV